MWNHVKSCEIMWNHVKSCEIMWNPNIREPQQRVDFEASDVFLIDGTPTQSCACKSQSVWYTIHPACVWRATAMAFNASKDPCASLGQGKLLQFQHKCIDIYWHLRVLTLTCQTVQYKGNNIWKKEFNSMHSGHLNWQWNIPIYSRI